MSHLFNSPGHGVFSPDGKVDITPERAAELNKAAEESELRHWATKPELFAPAYYRFPQEVEGKPYRSEFHPSCTGATVSTWTGAVLGVITSAHVYRHNFGARMVAITV